MVANFLQVWLVRLKQPKINIMTEDAKKVWEVMETYFGWSNQPKDFHLEYFEDIVKATKQALTIPAVVGRSEQLSNEVLKTAIAKAKPNMDKINDVDEWLDSIR
jgi:hypothetical protein